MRMTVVTVFSHLDQQLTVINSPVLRRIIWFRCRYCCAIVTVGHIPFVGQALILTWDSSSVDGSAYIGDATVQTTLN